MRLICPNCGAQYEVDASMIPDEGRDVQCSSCGNTWFQRGASSERDLMEDLEDTLVSQDVSDADDDYDAPLQDDASEDRFDEAFDAALSSDDDDPEDTSGVTAAAAVAAAAAAPRKVSEDVLGVLREEAEHEARARAQAEAERPVAEAAPEIDERDIPDLDIVDAEEESRAQQARERMARLRGIEPEEQDKSASRSDLLPDIDEINSTLRAESERQKEAGHLAVPPSDIETKRRGFRLGFGTSLLIVAILTSAYVYAAQIVRMVPFTEPVLVSYVQLVNDMRSRLEAGMQSTLNVLSGGDDDSQSEG